MENKINEIKVNLAKFEAVKYKLGSDNRVKWLDNFIKKFSDRFNVEYLDHVPRQKVGKQTNGISYYENIYNFKNKKGIKFSVTISTLVVDETKRKDRTSEDREYNKDIQAGLFIGMNLFLGGHLTLMKSKSFNYVKDEQVKSDDIAISYMSFQDLASDIRKSKWKKYKPQDSDSVFYLPPLISTQSPDVYGKNARMMSKTTSRDILEALDSNSFLENIINYSPIKDDE